LETDKDPLWDVVERNWWGVYDGGFWRDKPFRLGGLRNKKAKSAL